MAEAFQSKFGEELPEILSESHQAIVVAEEIDPSTERIVRFLSDAGISINVAIVQHFQTADGQEMLAQVFLIEPAEIEAKAQAASKRKPPLSFEELQTIAEENGVGTLYTSLVNGLEGVFDKRKPTTSNIAFSGKLGGGVKVILSLVPTESNIQRGLRFRLFDYRLATYLQMGLEQVSVMLPKSNSSRTSWPNPRVGASEEEIKDPSLFLGYFNDMAQVQSFVEALKKAKAQNANPQH